MKAAPVRCTAARLYRVIAAPNIQAAMLNHDLFLGVAAIAEVTRLIAPGLASGKKPPTTP
jgi:hypothetical protein